MDAEKQQEEPFLVWEDPPSRRRVSQAERVLGELRARPGQWALIARSQGLPLLPWWAGVVNAEGIEWVSVPERPESLFGPCRIYARAHPPGGRVSHESL